MEILRDFSTASLWLVDHARNVRLELLIDEESDPPISALAVGDGGFMQHEPCGDDTSHYDGDGQWRGRSVKVHTCLDDRNVLKARELLDTEYGIVLYRRTPDGIVDEIQRIRSRRFPQDHFKPRARDRAVDDQEFFFGTLPIEPYQESESAP